MTDVILGLLFVIAAIVAMVWRTLVDARAIADGAPRTPAPNTFRGPGGSAGLATGDVGSMGLGIGGGSAGHAGGGACGGDGGGGGHC